MQAKSIPFKYERTDVSGLGVEFIYALITPSILLQNKRALTVVLMAAAREAHLPFQLLQTRIIRNEKENPIKNVQNHYTYLSIEIPGTY